VKLLVDENLSPSLVSSLSDLFPGSEHVYVMGMGGAVDTRLWEYARNGGFAILSKDNDFRQRAFVSGAPPKVIWLDVGNAGTGAIVELLRRSRLRIETFNETEEAALLILNLRRVPELGG
jgi:predicted nuclease of predicted toxin-antitoxin system